MTPLSKPVPLRSSTDLGGYREAVPLPHRYGTTGGGLVQYNDSRTLFLWADHACVAVDEVEVGGQAVGDWDFANAVDPTGHAVALVRFGQPQDEGVELRARGRGKRHPASGALMTNPADVVWDVLANIAGRPIAAATLDAFRRACEREGLEIGGSLEQTDSVQAVVRGICASVGAIFCPDMRGLCKLWPEGAAESSMATVSDGAVSARADLRELVNDLTLQFAWEGDRPRASVRLDAPASVARFGRIPRERPFEAKWITSARVAVAVGRRLLRQAARPQWTVEAETRRPVSVGDIVTLSHAALPVAGVHLVRAVSRAPEARTTGITVLAPTGDAPVVRLVSQGVAFDPTQYSNATVETVGGMRILTLREENGAPIVGAKVTLDGGIVAYTDAGGRVSFPVSSMPPGEHTLLIETTDGRTLSTTVLIA